MSDEIRWNKKRHDARTALSARDLAKVRIGKIYADWKSKLTSRRKRKVEDLVPLTRKLKEQITQALKDNGLLEDDYGKQTLHLLDEKISDIIAVEMAGKIVDKQSAFINILTRFLPPREDDQPQTPELHEFRTASELESIPFIKAMASQEGYIGIIRDVNKLYATFANGELVLLGAISTRVGIEKMPTLAEFRKATTVRGNEQ